MSEYYFDHAASAPRRDEVTEAMAPWMHGVVGNPSGSHRMARLARKAVEEARDTVAALTGAKPGDVIFTAGGTESCTLAVAGVTHAHRRTHESSMVVSSPVEHHAVLDAVAMVANEPGVSSCTLGVDEDGVVDLSTLEAALAHPNVALVSVMSANNETGVVQPIEAVAALAAAAGVVSHSDVVAAAPWMDLRTWGGSLDMLSLCGHKLGGPVNAGALILRRSLTVDALTPGGGQEKGRRGGTVDVAACVGLAAALSASDRDRERAVAATTARRDELATALASLPGCAVTAATARRLPGTVHVTFDGLVSDELLFLLDQAGVYASAAASCSSGAAVSSHVLAAMGVSPSRAKGSLRLSFGAETSAADCAAVASLVAAAVTRLQAENGPRP